MNLLVNFNKFGNGLWEENPGNSTNLVVFDLQRVAVFGMRASREGHWSLKPNNSTVTIAKLISSQ